MKRTALLVALVATFLVGALVGPGLLGAESASRSDDQPAYSYSLGTGSCVEEPAVNPDSGWAFVGASGEYYSVHLNTTVVHPAGERVDANVSEFENGTYHIALDVVADDETATSDAAGCRHAATLDLATGLQRPEFVVTFEGRHVRTVRQEETVGNLYPFPASLNVTNT